MFLGSFIILATILFMIERRNNFPDSIIDGWPGLGAAFLYACAGIILLKFEEKHTVTSFGIRITCQGAWPLTAMISVLALLSSLAPAAAVLGSSLLRRTCVRSILSRFDLLDADLNDGNKYYPLHSPTSPYRLTFRSDTPRRGFEHGMRARLCQCLWGPPNYQRAPVDEL